MHREPEVPEAEAQVGKWLGRRARFASKDLAPLHSVKNGILQNACSSSPKRDAGLGKCALMRKEKIKQHSSHLRKIGACVCHQPLDQRKENLLWTPERRCT